MDDPYRGIPENPCPRCLAPLQGDRIGRMECPRGCGEWLAKHLLEGLVSDRELLACEDDVGSLIDRPFPPARCPTCERTMAVRLKYRLAFDHCIEHGIWLDRGERPAFDAGFELWRKLDDD